MNRRVDRDLETIWLEAPGEGPAAAVRLGGAAVADDLERYLRGEPIPARGWT